MPRMAVTELIAECQRRYAALDPEDRAKVDITKLSKVPIQDILNELQASWTWEIWDGTSPINGASADLVKERQRLDAESQVFLLRRDGRIVFLQPSIPHTGEKLTAANVRDEALKFRDSYVNDHIIDTIFERMMS